MNTVTAPVQIMNSALRKLGAERILSEDDSNNRARLVKESYPIQRDALLRSHPWRFNKAYASLALITPKPPEIFDYDYVFKLPTDCLRVFQTDLGPDATWEELENGRFGACSSEVKIKFGRNITDVTKFDANFIEALAWAIAADIAYSLTQSTAAAEAAQKNFNDYLRSSRSYSAQAASVRAPQSADDWVGARR